MSAHLEAHREQYYERLRAITAENDWQGWIVFFLNALCEQASADSKRVMGIQALYERMKLELLRAIGAQFVLPALEVLFRMPVFSSTDFIRESGIARRSALRVLSALKNAAVLSTLKPAAGRRPEVLIFGNLIEATEERKGE